MDQFTPTWTEALVKDRLEEAAKTMRHLPAVKAKGYFTLWPAIKHDAMEKLQMDRVPKKWPATAAQITRMEEVCEWLLLLDDIANRRLLWARAERLPWRLICERFDWSRATANRRWKDALLILTRKLNQQPIATRGEKLP